MLGRLLRETWRFNEEKVENSPKSPLLHELCEIQGVRQLEAEGFILLRLQPGWQET